MYSKVRYYGMGNVLQCVIMCYIPVSVVAGRDGRLAPPPVPAPHHRLQLSPVHLWSSLHSIVRTPRCSRQGGPSPIRSLQPEHCH